MTYWNIGDNLGSISRGYGKFPGYFPSAEQFFLYEFHGELQSSLAKDLKEASSNGEASVVSHLLKSATLKDINDANSWVSHVHPPVADCMRF
jgi:hypothetical protein